MELLESIRGRILPVQPCHPFVRGESHCTGLLRQSFCVGGLSGAGEAMQQIQRSHINLSVTDFAAASEYVPKPPALLRPNAARSSTQATPRGAVLSAVLHSTI